MAIDYASFNELSCQPNVYSSAQLRTHLIAFVQTFDRAWQMGLRHLRVRPDFTTTQTTDGRLLIEVISALPHSERGILLRAADMPHIRDEQIDEVERFVNTNVHGVDGTPTNEAEGFLCALIQKTLAMSIPSEQRWQGAVVKLRINKEGDRTMRDVDVPHASNSAHLNSHAALIGKITRRVSPNSANPLPNSNFSTRFIASNNWPATLQSILAGPPGQKAAQIAEFAATIAAVNGYVEERKLSTMNQKATGGLRQIFSLGEHEKTLYVSTDFEKGAFEVCGEMGKHLGEWSFAGIKQGDADTSGSHDIILSRGAAWGTRIKRFANKLRK
jgi:hypothetical protein